MVLLELTGKPAQRVRELKEGLISQSPGICPERARYYTEAYQRFESDPSIIRRAKALKMYLEKITITIGPNDLLLGNQASRPRWAPIFPEYSWEWVYEELDEFGSRSYDRFQIDSDAREELRQILPWWKGKSLYERIAGRQPEEVKAAAESGVINWTGQATSGEGHIVIDHQLVLEHGFHGIVVWAQKMRDSLDLSEPDALRKRDFYEAVEIVFEGGIIFSRRLASEARKMADIEIEAQRRNELLEMAEICDRVPIKPAETYREAIQAVWLIHLIEQMESNGHSVSLGRFDQYIYPYFQRDLTSGIILPEQALELLEHFFIKLFTIIKLRPEKHSRTQSGYPMYQNLVIGGQTADGVDATNELSYLCLAALAEIRLSEPNFYIRCHENTPKELWRDAMQVVNFGMGMPAFVNDKVIVPSLTRRGVDLEDALNYSTMGCLEVQVPGKWGYRANGKSKVNLLKILELTLNDGTDPRTGIQLCKGFGTLNDFKTFPELLEAWRHQLHFYTKLHVVADNINDLVLEEMVPNPFCSALVRDCLARGKHLNEGGAIYDMTSGALVGVPNVGNALAAIKELVFDKKWIALEELQEALRSNYSGPRGEEIRQIIINRSPKYGEDNDDVDELTGSLIQDYERMICRYKNLRYGRGPIGGTYYPSTVTISANVPSGSCVGATPDGRRDGEPTADGVSPSQGTGSNGPTAIIHSVCKLPTVLVTGGQLLNMRIHPSSLSSPDGWEKMEALIETLFELDGWHLQINTISTEILREAQKHPENYKDLIVRVAGYSALFVALDPALQEDIIARLEHEI